MYRTVKIALILYFALFIAVLINLRKSAVTGYEISIYVGTPLLVWVFVIGGIIGGLIILVWQAFGESKGNLWLFGLLTIVVSNFVVSYLSALRGYFLYNPIDPSAHIGMALDILKSGHVGFDNIYPLLHILLAQISQTTGMTLVEIARLLPAVLSVLYIFYIYLLAALILKERRQVLLAVACAAPLLFSFLHTAVYPQAMAFFSLPLMFYLYFRDRSGRGVKSSYRALLLLLVVVIPFTHPQSALMAIAFLFTVEVTLYIYDKVSPTRTGSGTKLKTSQAFSLDKAFIAFILFYMWLSPTALYHGTVPKIFARLTGDIGASPPQLNLAVALMKPLPILDVIQYGLKSYGNLLVYAVLVALGLFLVIFRTFKGDRTLKGHFALAVWIVIGESLSVLFFFVVWVQVPSRVIAADNAMALSPIFIAFVSYYLLQKRGWRNAFKVAMVVLAVALTSVIGVFGLYRSPYVYQANWQANLSDVAGTKWVYDYREAGLMWNGLSVLHADLAHILGHDAYSTITDISMEELGHRIGYYGWFDVPTHFGYYGFWSDRNFNTIGAMYADKGHETIGGGGQYQERRYVGYWVITERAKIVCFNEELRQKRILSHSEIGRWDFDEEDFERIENDPTINRVYQNGSYEVWQIPTAHAD